MNFLLDDWLLHDLFFGKAASANGQLLVWGPVVWIPGIPENEKDCYLGVPLESQTTNPNQQLSMSWQKPQKFHQIDLTNGPPSNLRSSY